MSESESMEEVQLEFLGEDDEQTADKVIKVLEEKKPALKQRLESISGFKSRVLDLLHVAMVKNPQPELVLPFMADLVYYCTAQPDHSSHVLSKRISGMIMKYFNEKGEQLVSEESIEHTSDDFCTILDQVFTSIMKNKRIKQAHSSINPVLKKLLLIKHDTIEQKLRENFQKLLGFCLSKKDATYVELFVAQIMNQRVTYLELFHAELVELIKLRSEGGPKADLVRLKGIEVITKTIYKMIQKKDEQETSSLCTFLKASSKELKRIVVSVFHSHDDFKNKKISILRKYLELIVTLLRAYDHCGLGKRFKALKDAFESEKKNLPEDPMLKKVLEKITEMHMALGEEAAD